MDKEKKEEDEKEMDGETEWPEIGRSMKDKDEECGKDEIEKNEEICGEKFAFQNNGKIRNWKLVAGYWDKISDRTRMTQKIRIIAGYFFWGLLNNAILICGNPSILPPLAESRFRAMCNPRSIF